MILSLLGATRDQVGRRRRYDRRCRVVAWLTLGGIAPVTCCHSCRLVASPQRRGAALVINIIVLVIVSAATRAAAPVEEDLTKEYATLPT